MTTFPYSNVAEAMVSKGYASVIRYKQDDDQRASCYDDLLSAEAKAIKSAKGIHNKKEIPLHRVADISSVSHVDFFFLFIIDGMLIVTTFNIDVFYMIYIGHL